VKIGVKMMDEKIKNIMDIMNTIEYGFKDENGNNLFNIDSEKFANEFDQFYYLQAPFELLNTRCGVCWDQVELERKLFKENAIPFKTYFIYMVDNDSFPSHTFLTYEMNHKYYWFEHSWEKYQGIYEYESELDLLLNIKELFRKEYDDANKDYLLFIYEYQKPKEHITCTELYRYIGTQKLIKTNSPLYFYHLVDKNCNMENGLMSLQYMYDKKMFDLFDKNVLKYKNRILNDWNIPEYKGKEDLTREDYLDALNIFRGEYGSCYIYFFRYPPYKALGNKIKELSSYKDIYRINLNDEEVQKYIIDIFYGFDMSNSDHKTLDKAYYENISKEEYFSKYDDSLTMNFSTLNHIGICFINGNCPIRFLEKVDWK
jgi:hypothetical protein